MTFPGKGGRVPGIGASTLEEFPMRVLFLHHQQRHPHTEEPGYNELYRPLMASGLVEACGEWVYQSRLRALIEACRSESGRDQVDFLIYREANRRLAEEFLDQVAQARPELLVYSATWPNESIHPELFIQSKERFPGLKLFCQLWDYDEDSHTYLWYEREIIACADLVSIPDSYYRVRRLREGRPPYTDFTNTSVVHWLPTLPDPALFRLRPEVTPDLDVLVLGSSEGRRAALIAGLAQRYGQGFRHVGGYQTNDATVPFTDYAAAIHRARIVVNSQTVPHRVQVKGRVREVLACRGFLLDQENAETLRYFRGSGVPLFTDFDDLIRQIDVFLSSPDRREGVKDKSYAWYCRMHALTDYVRTIARLTGVGQ
jgi:hypothetical protein